MKSMNTSCHIVVRGKCTQNQLYGINHMTWMCLLMNVKPKHSCCLIPDHGTKMNAAWWRFTQSMNDRISSTLVVSSLTVQDTDLIGIRCEAGVTSDVAVQWLVFCWAHLALINQLRYTDIQTDAWVPIGCCLIIREQKIQQGIQLPTITYLLPHYCML
jgi:hypothetical protein